MPREMRRKNQQLTEKENIAILNSCTSGVLALEGENGYPYAVPLSYVYYSNNIYFHCAKQGYKTDALKNNNKVSFCVIEKDQIKPNKLTTYYRSVIVTGKADIITNEEEKRYSLNLLSEKYSANFKELYLNEIDKFIKNVSIIKLSIEHLSGKEAIELAKAK